jgi:oligopeptide transport system substrate-binding protein
MMDSMRRVIAVLFSTSLALLAQSVQSAEAGAGAPKILRTSMRTAEIGFDCQRLSDVYSNDICAQIFETVLDYDYLARPAKLVPNLLTKMPEPEQNGLSYTLHFKSGIYFASDSAFHGKHRELVAKDLEYAIKRLLDPSLSSPNAWLVEGRIVGLDQLAESAKKSGHFNYDAPVSGLNLLDRYTLRITLTKPDFNFLYLFAMTQMSPVAREVVEYYGADIMAHPVGTGPFKLAQWVRRSKIVLEKNPDYRGTYLDTTHADMNDEWDREVVKDIAGKRLPLLDRIEIYPIESEQPYFLAFMNGEHDLTQEIPSSYISQVTPNGKLAPSLAKQGVRAFRELQPEFTYDAFNMDDHIVGGYDPQHVALRRAMSMGYNRAQEIEVIRNNTPMAAQSPIPPGVVGYDPTFTAVDQDYDPARAKALLDIYGYLDRDGDGYREQPDGSPLLIDYKIQSGSAASVQMAQLWQKSMRYIGIRMRMTAEQFGDLIRDQKVGKFQMSGAAWLADYPDAQNFLQLFYGPNKSASNNSRFDLPQFNRLYEQALTLPDSAQRNALYREMSRYILAYAPVHLGVTRSWVHLLRPWVHGYKKHPMYHSQFLYLDIDVAAQQAARK